MKHLITLLATLLLFGTVQAADNGLWYNPERNGEGLNLTTRDSTCVLFFYTYVDNSDLVPPSVSPPPPAVKLKHQNSAVWYYGQGADYNGETCTGNFYFAEAFDYPEAIEGEVGHVDIVGTFALVRDGDGWLLDISYKVNFSVPWYVSFYDLHDFPVPLITD